MMEQTRIQYRLRRGFNALGIPRIDRTKIWLLDDNRRLFQVQLILIKIRTDNKLYMEMQRWRVVQYSYYIMSQNTRAKHA